jgi:hypothetical protein
VIYTTLRSAFTTCISLRAATPTRISGRIDDEALDRHLKLIDEEITALKKKSMRRTDPQTRPIRQAS